MRIVLDTNVLLVILSKKSRYHWLFSAIATGKITIAVSTEILNEYSEILTEFYSNDVSENVIKLITELSTTLFINVYFKWGLIYVDYDDNKFLDCAIACNSDYIVTNDKHFNILNQIDFPKINIIDIETFTQKYQSKF